MKSSNDFGGIPLYMVYTYPYIFETAIGIGVSHDLVVKQEETEETDN